MPMGTDPFIFAWPQTSKDETAFFPRYRDITENSFSYWSEPWKKTLKRGRETLGVVVIKQK